MPLPGQGPVLADAALMAPGTQGCSSGGAVPGRGVAVPGCRRGKRGVRLGERRCEAPTPVQRGSLFAAARSQVKTERLKAFNYADAFPVD